MLLWGVCYFCFRFPPAQSRTTCFFLSNIHQGKNRLEKTVCFEIVPHKTEGEMYQEFHNIRLT